MEAKKKSQVEQKVLIHVWQGPRLLSLYSYREGVLQD